ncbi:uncharacterized protein IWZ02DRAFT_444455 [Phyllosticta citriasiana]|uniref:uncharacterized protein n=1 Tax=Phyllosticta citriasiana TaxID=595635 RepID=UPI0030FD5DDE
MTPHPESDKRAANASPSRLPTLSSRLPRPPTSQVNKENEPQKRRLGPAPRATTTKSTAGESAQEARNATFQGHGRLGSRTQSTKTKPASVRQAHDPQKSTTAPPAAAPGLTRRPTVTGNDLSRSTDLKGPTLRTRATMNPDRTHTNSESVNDRIVGQGNQPGTMASGASLNASAQQKARVSSRSRAATTSDSPSERTNLQPPIVSAGSKVGSPDKKSANSSAQVHTRSKSEYAATRLQTGRSTAKTPPAIEKDPTQNMKPTFSTLQQHYSPKKTTEPRKATLDILKASAKPSPDDDLALNVFAMQTELLQLYTLRESSRNTQAQWATSAERALRIQFYEVATAYHSMRKNEGEVQELVNLQALQEWSSGSANLGLAENVQLLGPVLNELRALTDSGGRYTRLVHEFEQWVAYVEAVWSQREAKQAFEVADGLGEEWKSEVNSLIRKVSLLAREMERIVEPRSGSSIAAMVSQCRSLVQGMSKELQTMRRVEVDVAKREAAHVETGLESIATASLNSDVEALRAAWLSV